MKKALERNLDDAEKSLLELCPRFTSMLFTFHNSESRHEKREREREKMFS